MGRKRIKNYERQQQNIQNANLSDADRADKLQALDTAHAARSEQIQREQQEADNKKAEFDKQVAVVGIVLQTALAVVKSLPNIPLAISIGLLGAAQLAAAEATKVPHYEHGIERVEREHIGLVGEGKKDGRYKPEIVKMPGKADMLVTKPTYIKLPVNAKVIPLVKAQPIELHEPINVMANKAIYQNMVIQMHKDTQPQKSNDDVVAGLDKLGKIIRKSAPKKFVANVYNDFGNYNYLNKNVFHRR